MEINFGYARIVNNTQSCFVLVITIYIWLGRAIIEDAVARELHFWTLKGHNITLIIIAKATLSKGNKYVSCRVTIGVG